MTLNELPVGKAAVITKVGGAGQRNTDGAGHVF